MAKKVQVRFKKSLNRQIAEEIIWQQFGIEVSDSLKLRFEPYGDEPQYRMDMGYCDIWITQTRKPGIISLTLNTHRGNYIEFYYDCHTWENIGEIVHTQAGAMERGEENDGTS